jgi:hypothetical protein
VVRRFFIGVVGGALAGVTALTLWYGVTPAITMDMDRPVSAVLTGTYDPERAGDDSYVWTARNATLRLPGLDRQHAWTCVIRLRGARQDAATLPEALVAVDGVTTATVATGNEYADVSVTVPPASHTRGVVITLTASTTFVPSAEDRRELGLMVDRWTCAPGEDAWVMPPQAAITAAAAGAAALGAAAALIGLTPIALLVTIVTLAGVQAVALASEFGAYTAYPGELWRLSLLLAGVLWGGVSLVQRVMGRPLSQAARLAAVIAVVALDVKLLALLHPSKAIVDAVFHAHRLQWVLDGRFLFTQPMPSGVQFPYAIGLYVFAAPWSLLTTDFVWLLRLIVSAAEATGSVLVYVLISRVWHDRAAGVWAAALFPLVPRSFELVGNANMTNAFAQAVALAAMTAAVLWRWAPGEWRPGKLVALTLLIAAGLLSHISTLTLLGATLVMLTGLYAWRGSPDLRASARAIAVALTGATAIAVVLYYRHFADVFVGALAVRATPAAAEGAMTSLGDRAASAATLSLNTPGVPIVALAMMGVITCWRQSRLRDRLGLAIGAWLLTALLVDMSVVLTPVEKAFQRYADEFIIRVALAAYPAVILLAGVGAAWGWRTSAVSRVAVIVGAGAALWLGASEWLAWLR